MATSSDKETIYIDIDDEITTIIEKVRSANEKIVALVLPKRATVLQSIVNMKLLKRTAEAEKKSLVLITSEAGLLPLAGAVGLYVAKNLQSKPAVPAVATDEAEEVADEASLDDEPEVTTETAGDKPIGELAGGAAAAAASDEAIETVQLDDEAAADDKKTDSDDKPKAPKQKKNKKLAVPNFERFRLLLALGILAVILLIVGVIFAATALPKAQITIVTDTSDVPSALTFTADTAAKQLSTDPSKLVVPAISQQTQKTQNQQVNTTGQKNNGTAATGSVTMTACITTFGFAQSVPAGTPVTSGGLTFITKETTTFSHSGTPNGSCIQYQANNATDVTAQTGGSKYNLNNANFSVYGRSDVSASGSTSGGTDDIIQVVSQADIDSAKQKIASQDTSTIKQQLENQIKQAGLFPIESTFNAGTPTTTTSSNVGDQASTVTVTQAVTYTMYGVKEADLKTIVDNDIKDKIDPSKQSILTEGLDKATFHVNSTSATSQLIAMNTTATAGPDLHVDTLKKQLAGKKAGEVRDTLKNDPGVVDVKVNLSPFWVTSVPGKANKVTITFQKSNQ